MSQPPQHPLPTGTDHAPHAAPGRPLPAAVLWDMDGTLVDTEPYWMECEQQVIGRAGVRWSREHALTLVGKSLPEAGAIIRDYVLAAGGPALDPAEVVAEMLTGVAARVRAVVPWRPGARELLAATGAAGVPSALVTMSYRSLADAVVELLPGAFDVVVAGDEVERGKPHPDPYLRAAHLLGVRPGDCVALEDSPTGVRSAEAAGCRTVAVPHLVPIEAAPGRSRVPSLTVLDLPALARLRAGEVLDLL
ncbi:HAD superfamily hydrolase (TIGR01509 family) [Kineococcus xinjiangensis]|uniref:HAD superfamily hydrolase (TIGR01509 family) n=1 Tax=Kineococcus xinjiangensis TaxID=512762 RepID=A0A2S6IKB3_9ACTN|nr:HAD family phosphatase [Kineococcus xinjiangensis]PPK94667.1 HAD superfamily hydrolase (TIGR01509 family) [Kineococcus xinjiangensis]